MTHEDITHSPAISNGWKRTTVAGNLLLGAAELMTGNLNSLSVAADGVHNIGDAVTYNLQSNDILKGHTADKLQRRRRAAHWIIAVSSGAIGLKAGYDLTTDVEHAASNISVYAAGASCLFNGALLVRLRQGMRRTHQELGDDVDCHQEKDLTKHLLVLDIPSAVLALGGVWAQRQGYADAEQVAAISSGVLGVVAFRPTTANLSHDH
jgi:hypothetical protein